MSCSRDECNVSPPKKQIEKIRDPTPPPVVKREVKRNPTPQGDTLERIRVIRQPQTIIERVTEQPRKPPPKIIERIENEPCPPPVIINTCVFVEPSNRPNAPSCSSPRPRSSLSRKDVSKSNDGLLPATSFTSTSLDKGVKLRLTEETSKYKPITVYDMFSETVNKRPDALALAFKSKNDPDWNKITFKQYWEICRNAAKSFIKLGLNVNQCVGIIGFNSPEWFFSLLGAIFAG
jgi:hypothetical protein